MPRCSANLTLGNALARCGHEIEGREPILQRQMRALERRAVGDAELAVAGVAAQVVRSPGRMRLVNRFAMRAYRAIRPADGFKMRPAGFVIRKALEKGDLADITGPPPLRKISGATAVGFRHTPSSSSQFR